MDLNEAQLNGNGIPTSGPIVRNRSLAPGTSLELDLTITPTGDPAILGADSRVSVLAAEPGRRPHGRW
jgi:hypothetical protein